MPKRKLAWTLWATLGAAALVNLGLSTALAVSHKPFIGPLAGFLCCIPGFVMAHRAWKGDMPGRCAKEG